MPSLHEPRSSGLTYEPFYGLKEKPFSLTSDARFFFHSRSHAPAFVDLLAGIRRRESLNVLTGDIGTGKTTLCRAVLQNLDRKTFSAFVPDPFASREDLLKVILMDFGVLSVDDLTRGRLKESSRTELSYLLYEFLGTLAPLQAFAVVIIDEAQNLSVPLLEEVRILSEADGQLQVVLVGQLELRDKLKLPEMRQVDQRVSVHCNLAPLGCDGVAGYVAHRLQTAGGSPERVRFSPEAVEAIYRMSGGVPRVVNRLCDRALFQGYLRRAATIDLEILEAAIPDAVTRAVPTATPSTIQHSTPAPLIAPVSDSIDICPVDVWLAAGDQQTKTVALDVKTVDAVELFPSEGHRPTGNMPTQPPAALEPSVASRPKSAPRAQVQTTYMDKVISRWRRRLGTAVLIFASLAVSFILAPSLMSLATDLWTRSTALLAAPVAPTPPPARPLWLPPAHSVPLSPANLPADPPPAAKGTGPE